MKPVVLILILLLAIGVSVLVVGQWASWWITGIAMWLCGFGTGLWLIRVVEP